MWYLCKWFIYQAETTGKSQMAIDKMVEGRLRKYMEEVVLMEQKFIVNDSINIKVRCQTYSQFIFSQESASMLINLKISHQPK